MEKNMANRNKSIELRAFSIKSQNLTNDSAEYLNHLIDKLKKTKVKDRQMLINQDDPSGEQDLISNYSIQDEEYDKNLCATFMRMSPNAVDEHIDKKYFEANTFKIEDISINETKTVAQHKGHFYLCMNDKFLVTALLPKNTTIMRVQTYINWLLGISTLELTPIVEAPEGKKLSDLKSIKFSDPFCDEPDMFNETVCLQDKLTTFMSKIFLDTDSLKNIDLKQIISAELTLKLIKPKKMTEADYQQKYGAMLKPISDLENITFKDNLGNSITGEKIRKIKPILIEQTDNGYISEQQLNTEMATFLRELKP